jgi:CRP-like cAMP-binding protein
MQLLPFLAKSDIFLGLPEHYLKLISSASEFKSLKEGDYIFKEGEPAGHLFIVMCGQVRLWMKVIRPSRRLETNVALTTASAPHMIGIAALVRPSEYFFTARAVSNAECIRIDGTRLRQEMAADHELRCLINQNLVEILSVRLQKTLEVLGHDRASRLAYASEHGV